MIVLTVGSCSYTNEIYEYSPINVQGYIYLDHMCGVLSSSNRFAFEIIKKTNDNRKFQPLTVYLTSQEIKQLYKDPRSIWDKAEKWCKGIDVE